ESKEPWIPCVPSIVRLAAELPSNHGPLFGRGLGAWGPSEARGDPARGRVGKKDHARKVRDTSHRRRGACTPTRLFIERAEPAAYLTKVVERQLRRARVGQRRCHTEVRDGELIADQKALAFEVPIEHCGIAFEVALFLFAASHVGLAEPQHG